MSLRARLLIVLSVVVAAGLLVTDAVTYASIRSFLVARIDEQLEEARGPIESTIFSRFDGAPPGSFDGRRAKGGHHQTFPPGTYGEVRGADGSVVGEPVSFDYDDSIPLPALPAAMPAPDTRFEVGATGDPAFRYRVLVSTTRGGDSLIVAVPMNDVARTLGRLLWIEAVVTVAVLAGLSAMSWWIVRRGLRPLEQMGETADAIAAGDLSRRIGDTSSRTEVGRLGAALNAMLGRIEDAFSGQKDSEERLRRFVAEASHELRTPLTSIRGYAELFRRGADERPEDLAKAMRHIEDEAERMGVLVEELLLLARLDLHRPIEQAPVPLEPVARDAVLNARVADPDRPIELSVAASPVVMGDDARLRRVAGNLLSNALIHTPAGTPVRVSVGMDDGTAVLEVADEGPGMTESEARRIFERFYRGGRTRAAGTDGSGLGLSIAASIVEAHGGSIDVVTAPGKGARFRVAIPAASSGG